MRDLGGSCGLPLLRVRQVWEERHWTDDFVAVSLRLNHHGIYGHGSGGETMFAEPLQLAIADGEAPIGR